MGNNATMTEFDKRIIMVVTTADRDAANQQAAAIDPDVGGVNTFSVPLSATGENPPTHYACDTVIKAATLATVESIQAASFPDGMVCRSHNEYDGDVVAKKSFSEVLADMGLTRIDSEA